MKVGVVIWAEGTNVKFRISEGVRVERGQLLKVSEGGSKYILRVYDFRPESLLTPAEIARLSHKRERGEEVVLYDRNLRLYDTALATIICEVDEGGRVHGPTSVPKLFSDVETLNKIDLELLNLDKGDITLGVIRIGHKETDVKVSLEGSKIIPHHVLVSGVTGAGKSNLSKVLAFSVMKVRDRKYSLVLFDTESEYFKGGSIKSYGLAHLREAEDRLFYVTNLVGEPRRIKVTLQSDGGPLERSIMAHPLKVSYAQLHPLDFIMTGELSPPQEELLWLLWREKGEEWIRFLIYNASSLTYRLMRKTVHINTINTVKRKVRYLLGNGDIFVKEDLEANLFHAILGAVGEGRVILIDLPHASEGEEKLLVTAVARRIFSTYEEIRKTAPSRWERLPYVLIVIEEAHKYLSKTSLMSNGEMRENIFSIISKRGRKYKVGGLYITQMPGELIEPVVRQALTKVILSLPTKPDYLKVIQYSPYLDEAEQEIKTLDKGEALLISPPAGIRFAVPIKVFSFEELVRRELGNEGVGEVSPLIERGYFRHR